MNHELSKETLDHLKAIGFYGTDANLEESLFEYGFICRDTAPDEVQIIYYLPGLDDKIIFGMSSVTEQDVWEAATHGKGCFLSTLEAEGAQGWLDSMLMHKISDIQSHLSWFDWSTPSETIEDLATWPTLEKPDVDPLAELLATSDDYESMTKYAVDIPDSNFTDLTSDEQPFINVATFTSRAEAIEFARLQYGADENGMINLITKY